MACVGLGLLLPAGAAADGPPYSDGSIPDAIESCAGGPYDIVERDGDLYVRCQGTVPNDWRVFTTGASLTPTAATITLSRAHVRGRALISYQTQPGTATPDVDYLTTSGRVYLADYQSTATVTVPLPVIPPPPGAPARTFTVTFGDPVALGLSVPTATVELPATVPAPAAPTIDSGPSATTPLRRATFAFRGEPDATFECRIDAQPFGLCVSPRDVSNVAVGGHRFEVRQRDGDDGPWSSVAGYDWTVAGAPDPGFPSGPPYNSGRLDADYACDGGLYDITVIQGDRYVRCAAGGGFPWQSFSATATVSGGTATVTLTREDAEGAPALVEFRTVPGTAEAGTDYAALEGELFFRAGVTTRTLQIPVVRHPGATADLEFELALRDPTSLSLSVPASTTVTIPADPAPPTITGAPAAQSVLSAPSFAFTGETGASFECRLDEQAFAACTSAKTYTGVAPGEHRFEVRQRASHGGLSEPVAHEWTVLPSPDPGFPVGPPYGPSRDPDADYICDGGFYSLITHNVDRYARCLGAVGKPWQTFTSTVLVGASTATITITREQQYAPVLVGFATEADTAQAGRDFTPISGELYFSESTTTRSVTVPIVRDPQASSDRSFALRLTDVVNLRLTLPPTSVTIPGHPPTELAPPTIGGTARVDEHVSATEGEWTHEPTSFAYAWQRCDADGESCVPIPGATDAEYPPEDADVGARLRVEVTASNGSGSAVARSAPSAVVRPELGRPTITGGPTGNQILHNAQFGFTGESGATFECRLDEGPFAPCTSPRTLTQLPAGEHWFEVRQRATDGVVSSTALRVWTVLPSPDPEYPLAPPYGHVNDPDEACEGGAYALKTHNADRFTACLGGGGHPWQRFTSAVAIEGDTATVTVTRESGGAAALLAIETENGTAVAGRDYEARTGELYFAPDVTSRTVEIPVARDPDASSDRTFTLALRDAVDANLRVEDATVTIAGNAPTSTAPPTIDGVARVGHELTATDGDWTHQPTGYARAWERCDASGDDCAPIADATGATYEPVAADAGARLRVAVSATNGSGTTVAHSAPSAVIRPVLGAPTVSGGPEGETQQTSATFTLAGEAGATFECRRDDGAFAACPSPVTYDGLAVGAHELAVRQVADDGVVSGEAVRRWTVVSPDPGPGGGGDGDGGGGGDNPPGPGGGGGEHPPGPGPGDQPPGGEVPPPGPGATPKTPVRMTTIRLELRFCAGCTRPSARDRKRLQRLRARVSGSRLLAIDGYGDPGRTRAQNRRLARTRARAVERIVVSGVKRRPARRTVVGHDRLTRVESTEKAAAKRKGSVARTVTIRVVRRR